MSIRRRATASVLLLAGVFVFAAFRVLPSPKVEIIDFAKAARPTSPTWLAEVQPPSRAEIKEFHIPITHRVIEVAPGVQYQAWTFGNTVPGPVIRVRQGDRVRVVVTNESDMPHSIDFHAARIPMDKAFGMILPGQEHRFEFIARDPGVFLVHCGTAPVLMHIMQGMYLPIIVDPADGWGREVDHEYVLVQSEFYVAPGSDSTAPRLPDWDAANNDQPTYVVWNGQANQYVRHPIQLEVGDRIRLFVVDAGPSHDSDFHIVGTIFDRVIPDGVPAHALTGVQTWPVPAGGGAVFEAHFGAEDSGEGQYAFVTHSFVDASKGAVGILRVGNPSGPMASH
jgi:nitrite reductase (NO-forming)